VKIRGGGGEKEHDERRGEEEEEERKEADCGATECRDARTTEMRSRRRRA